jgi:hypothetical protein
VQAEVQTDARRRSTSLKPVARTTMAFGVTILALADMDSVRREP